MARNVCEFERQSVRTGSRKSALASKIDRGNDGIGLGRPNGFPGDQPGDDPIDDVCISIESQVNLYRGRRRSLGIRLIGSKVLAELSNTDGGLLSSRHDLRRLSRRALRGTQDGGRLGLDRRKGRRQNGRGDRTDHRPFLQVARPAGHAGWRDDIAGARATRLRRQ